MNGCAICGTELVAENATGVCLECQILARNSWFGGEVWIPLVGFVGFDISDRGRIRDANKLDIRELDRSHRYPRVWLNGRKHYVHHLMAASWIGPRPGEAMVLHADDDPANLAIANIDYGTAAQNAQDRKRNRGRGKRKRNYRPRPPDWCKGCGYFHVVHGEHRTDCTATPSIERTV